MATFTSNPQYDTAAGNNHPPAGHGDNHVTPISQDLDRHEFEVCQPHFDVTCYKAELTRIGTEPDADVDLCRHFCEKGWRLGLSPNRWFAVTGYLSRYEDVAAAKINPFYHYLVAGEREGRQTSDSATEFDSIINILKPLKTLSEEAKSWAQEMDAFTLLDEHELGRNLASLSAAHKSSTVLSVSHDNYLQSAGGIQVCIKREMELFIEKGVDYIHIFPTQPLPKLSDDKSQLFKVGISSNGVLIGHTLLTTLGRLLSRQSGVSTIVLHSVLGYKLQILAMTIRQLNAERVLYWAHDYFPFCPSWTLMRNKVHFCDAPPESSSMCELCYFGTERASHLSAFRSFFSAVNPEIICPSSDVNTRYKRLIELNSLQIRSITTLEHFDVRVGTRLQRKTSRRYRVAFLGHPAHHKGWSDFLKLFRSRKLSELCEFYHFGAHDTQLGHGLIHVHVNTSSNAADSMATTIRNHKIDYCFIWSQWPETFGITSVEAILGGARVITNNKSGNVADFSAKNDFGHIFCDVNSVIEWISDTQNLETLFFRKRSLFL
jgi:hypothetical protein